MCACGSDDTPARDAPPPSTVIYVVRHAETIVSTSNDPPLSAAGQMRADRLAGLLADKHVTAILTSQFIRTRDTAMPTATAAGIAILQRTVTTANASTYGTMLADEIRNTQLEHVVLVVGHSNTVPATVSALAGTTVAPIDDTDYDNFYTVTITGATATLDVMTY